MEPMNFKVGLKVAFDGALSQRHIRGTGAIAAIDWGDSTCKIESCSSGHDYLWVDFRDIRPIAPKYNPGSAKFWMVCCLEAASPTVKHSSLRVARKEAERLANANSNRTFVVLEAVASCRKQAVDWVEFADADPEKNSS